MKIINYCFILGKSVGFHFRSQYKVEG